MKRVSIVVNTILNPITFEVEIHRASINYIKVKFPEITDVRTELGMTYAYFKDEQDATAFVLKHGADFKV